MGSASASISRIESILNRQGKRDRIQKLEEQLENMCSYFDLENQRIKSEIEAQNSEAHEAKNPEMKKLKKHKPLEEPTPEKPEGN